MEKKKFSFVNFIKSSNGGDLSIVLLVLILCLFGIIMVFSASYYVSINESGTPYAYLRRQLLWFTMGLAAMLILSRIDYHFWINFTPIFYIVGLGLLVAQTGTNNYGPVLAAHDVTITVATAGKNVDLDRQSASLGIRSSSCRSRILCPLWTRYR